MTDRAKRYEAIRDAVRPQWDDARAARNRAGVDRLRRRHLLTRGGGALVVAALLALVAYHSLGPAAPGEPDDPTVRFSDGSVAVPDAPGSLIVEASSPELILVNLQEGRSRFKVTPDPKRRFVVRAGAARVTVLGTSFSVEHRSGGQVQVQVSEGRVRVDAPGGTWTLNSGEGGEFPGQPRADASPHRATTPEGPDERVATHQEPPEGDDATPRAPTETPQPPPENPLAETSAPPERPKARAESSDPPPTQERRGRGPAKPQAAAGAPPAHEPPEGIDKPAVGWGQLAEERRFKEAAQLLTTIEPVEIQGASALIRAAEVMRFAGQPGRALAYLEAVERRYPQDAQAPLALFWRGRILLRGQPCRAAEVFARLQRQGGAAALQEDALAREVTALARCGRLEQARQRARIYERRYPQGHHRGAMRRYTDPPDDTAEEP